jgi:hypothetical protein
MGLLSLKDVNELQLLLKSLEKLISLSLKFSILLDDLLIVLLDLIALVIDCESLLLVLDLESVDFLL